MKYMINQLNMYEFDVDTSITKKETKPVIFFKNLENVQGSQGKIFRHIASNHEITVPPK